MSAINDISEAWAGHSGLEVETWLKQQLGNIAVSLGEKFGYVEYNPQTLNIDFYDYEGGTVIGNIQLGGDVYTIDLHCNMSQVFYVLADETTKVMTIAPTTSKSPFGSTESEDVPESYTYTVAVKTPASSTYETKINSRIEYGGSASFDLKPYLLMGNNLIRVSVTGETSGQTKTTVFTGTVTSLFLSCSHAWQVAWEEGEDYVINGIRFAGTLNKTLHVSIEHGGVVTELTPVDYGPNISYTNTSTTYTIPASAFPITGEQSGNCKVSLWMTASGVSTPVVVFDIMCAKEGDTTPLVAINSVVPTAYNFTSGTLFSYAVYNADSAVFSLLATIGGIEYEILNEQPEMGLSANTQYPFSYALEVDTGSNNVQIGMMAITATAFLGATEGQTVEASTVFDNTFSYLATPGYVFYLNAATRSNNASDRETIINESEGDNIFAPTYSAQWTGMTWRKDGWTADEDGHRALVIPAGASVSVPDLRPMAGWVSYGTGMTVELMLKTGMPADYATPVMSFANDSVGVTIYPTKITVFSNASANKTSQSVVFAENTITHFVITFIKDYGTIPGRNLCSIYVNGISNINFPFDGLSNFGNGSLVIGQQNTDTYLYKMRIYGIPLQSSAVLTNFLNCIIDGVEFNRADVVAKNAVTDGSSVEYSMCKLAGYNIMVVILPNDTDHLPDINHQAKDSEGTAIKNARVDFEYADNSDKNASINKVKLDGQGTTSMKYYRWNLRFKTSDSTTWDYGDGTSDPNGKKGRMINDSDYVKVDRITAKKNYASSMQGHKMGLTGLYNDIFHQAPVSLGSHLPNSSYLVAVYQFPFVGFRKYSNGFYEYIGLYTAGPDKSSKTSFGHSTSTFQNLMSIEGPNHNPRGTRFLHPWVDVAYDPEKEKLRFGGDEAWDCAIAGPYETSNEGTQADWDAILALFESEWRPAYECVFNNSPYIAALSDALTESGYASLAAINADIEGFHELTTGGISNELLTFYDSNYNVIFYRTKTGQYETLSSVSSDPLLETNVVTPLYSAGYLSTQSPTTAEIIAARIGRFKATAPNYWDMDQLFYHYCYCILFGVTDNFAKNTYPFKFRGFNEPLAAGESIYCKRWGWRQDDLDTALATDNNGRSTKSYSIEHGDTNPSGGQIFNGGDSALWVIVRDYYQGDQKDMMGKIVQAMGGIASAHGITGNFTHETVFNVVGYYCWSHSSKYFSQTLYEDDRAWSYIEPWLANDSIKYNDVYPWEQANGDQLQAEKMWVTRRVAYIFSKYRIGAFTGTDTSYDGLSITLASSYTFKVWPAIDLYPVGSTGTTDSQGGRTRVGEYSLLPVAAGSGTTNNYIHGLDWIASLDDLSDMRLTDRGMDTNIAFSIKSYRLQNLKVGDADASNVLFNATSLAVESPSITSIDARNTVKITQGEVNLLKCPRLRTCLFAGSGAPGLILPIGAPLSLVSFPENAMTVFLYSLPFLTSANLTLPTLSKIENLFINDCDQLNPLAIAASILATTGNKLEFVTLNWSNVVSADVDTLFDLAELPGRIVYDNGILKPEEGLPDVEGTVQVPRLDTRDYDALEIISTEPYPGDLTKGLSNLFETNLYVIYDASRIYIGFVDPLVEQICISNWSTDGIGLTTGDAAAVTNFNGVFQNQEITSFNEFRYFTSWPNQTSPFSGSTLTEITFPENGRFYGALFLDNCPNLTTVNFSTAERRDDRYSAQLQTFRNSPNITTIYISSIDQYKKCVWSGDVNRYYSTDLPFWSNTDEPHYVYYLDGTEMREINIPSTWTQIDGGLFFGFNRVTSLTIPSTITAIGNSAFRGCSSITGTLNIPSSVTTIWNNAFQGCSNITGITGLANVQSIKDYAFEGCVNMSGTISNNVLTELRAGAFQSCRSLTNVYITTPGGITTIYGNNFVAGCSSLKNLTLRLGTGTRVSNNIIANVSSLGNTGDGTGTLIIEAANNSTTYEIGANAVDAVLFRKIILDIEVANCSRAIASPTYLEYMIFKKNITATNGLPLWGGRPKYIKYCGTFVALASAHAIFYSANSSKTTDVLHLSYNGIACTAISDRDFASVDRIYVGDGSSAAHDDAILALYRADSNWSYFAAKMDTWYNYNHAVPSGYTQLEYVGTDGTAFLDTGVSGDNDNLTIVTVFESTIYAENGYIFGNKATDTQNRVEAYRASMNTRLWMKCNDKSSTYYTMDFNGKVAFTLSKGKRYIKGAYSTYAVSEGTANDTNICLGKASLTADAVNIGLRIYCFRIVDNGTTMIDLVPCTRNSDDKVGFYDRVSGTFKPSEGTGEFVAGPAATLYSEDS